MNYNEKNGIRTYTISRPQEELTSDEVEVISELIKERLDHAVSDGFTNSGDVLVKFVYTGSTPSYKYNTTKSMNSFLIREFTKSLYQQHVDLSLPPNEDYIYEIIGIRINVVPLASGGCWDHNYSETITDGVKRKRLLSTNNNCFFRCLKALKPDFNPTITVCDEIRRVYGYAPKTPVPVPVAWDIIKRYQLPVGLFCEETKEHYGKEYLTTIELAKGHYSLIIEQEKKKFSSCGDTYYKNHTCSVVCSRCGTRYKKKNTSVTITRLVIIM